MHPNAARSGFNFCSSRSHLAGKSRDLPKTRFRNNGTARLEEEVEGFTRLQLKKSPRRIPEEWSYRVRELRLSQLCPAQVPEWVSAERKGVVISSSLFVTGLNAMRRHDGIAAVM